MTDTALKTVLPPRERAGSSPQSTLTGNLGVTAIVFMVVAAAAPLTVIGGAAPLGILLGNGAGYPAMYAISGIILLIFTVGLNAMGRAVPKPGAFAAYIGQGLGGVAGIAGSWLALLVYSAIQTAVYAYMGADLASIIATTGISLPWWLVSAAIIGVVGYLGYHDIELSSKVLGVLLIAEIGISLILAVAVIISGGASGLDATTFSPSAVTSGAPGVGLMMAFAGFIGFEATSVFRSEAVDPDRTIPRATYIAVLVIGVFYAFAGWALVEAWGPEGVVAAASAHPGDLIVVTGDRYLGAVGAATIQVLLLTSLFACVLSFHTVLTRYLHTMGSNGALPSRLAQVHPRHMSPHYSSLTQSVAAVLVMLAIAILRWDPVLQGFTWLSGVATLGIVVMMAITSLAIVVFFRRNELARMSSNVWKSTVAPAVSLVLLTGVAAVIVAYFTTLVDGPWSLALAVMAPIPLFILGGAAHGFALKIHNPQSFAKVVDSLE